MSGSALGTLADPIVGMIITIMIFGIVWQSAKAVFTRMLDGTEPDVPGEIRHAAEHVPGVLSINHINPRCGSVTGWQSKWMSASTELRPFAMPTRSPRRWRGNFWDTCRPLGAPAFASDHIRRKRPPAITTTAMITRTDIHTITITVMITTTGTLTTTAIRVTK